MKAIKRSAVAIALLTFIVGGALLSVPGDGAGAVSAPTSAGKIGSGTAASLQDPALQECQSRGIAVCDPVSWAADQQESSISQPAQSTHLIARGQVESMAKGTHDANVYSRLMSGLQAESLTGESRISLIDKTRPVWVVTVVVPIQRENSIVGSSARLPGYSAIFDAVSGEVTDICNGCLWLDHSD